MQLVTMALGAGVGAGILLILNGSIVPGVYILVINVAGTVQFFIHAK